MRVFRPFVGAWCVVLLMAPLMIGPLLPQMPLLPFQAHAQQVKKPAPNGDKPPVANPEIAEPVAPYDDKLLRLSEILGAIHYLRALCGVEEDNRWRNTMNEIIESEDPGPIRRSQLISNFNRGYRTFRSTYSDCTPSARLAADRYLKEGASLASQITLRYGG